MLIKAFFTDMAAWTPHLSKRMQKFVAALANDLNTAEARAAIFFGILNSKLESSTG